MAKESEVPILGDLIRALTVNSCFTLVILGEYNPVTENTQVDKALLEKHLVSFTKQADLLAVTEFSLCAEVVVSASQYELEKSLKYKAIAALEALAAAFFYLLPSLHRTARLSHLDIKAVATTQHRLNIFGGRDRNNVPRQADDKGSLLMESLFSTHREPEASNRCQMK